MSYYKDKLSQIVFGEYKNKKIDVNIECETPRLYLPFGLSCFTPPVGPVKWNIDFSLKGYETHNSYVNLFYKFINDVEKKLIDNVFNNSENIFGYQMTYEQIQKMFNSNIKVNKSREPNFRAKVDHKSLFFNRDRDIIDDEFTNGLYQRKSGKALLEVSNVYFLNNMFGITWKIKELVVYEPENLRGFHFIF